MAPDIGSYFDRLTRTASGGRRLDRVVSDVVGKGRTSATRATRAARRTADEIRRRSRRPSTQRESGRGTLPPEGVVHIEYSPRIDGDPDPGEVVWTWVPYEEDPTQGKDRPVIVIGRRGDRLVGVPLTTKRDEREAQIAVGAGDWDPKRRPSYARIWRMLDVDPGDTRREGAVLDRIHFEEVVGAVDRYYDVRRTG
jgi:hypothetical protein